MSKAHLIVQLSHDRVRFIRSVSGEIEQNHNFLFKEKNSAAYIEQLEHFLNKTDFRSLQWDEYSLSWFSRETTLIPLSVFQESSKESIFNLSFGETQRQEEIQFDRIQEIGIVNVYSIPTWVKEYFTAKFPRIIIQHEGSYGVRGLTDISRKDVWGAITVHDDFALTIGFDQGKLIYYNTFPLSNTDDILYHFAHTIQKLDWMESASEWAFISENENIDFEELHQNMSKIDVFNQVNLVEDSSWTSKIHSLCV